MKKYITLPAILFIFMITGLPAAYAQEPENPFQKILENKQYVFMAQTFTTNSVPVRQLIDGYYIRLSNDSLISVLPYYGQQYAATQTGGGIEFKSIKFDHTAVKKKKEKIQITMRPRDIRDVQQLYLTVFPNGSAQLQILSTNREPMSFTGYITAAK